MSALRGEADMHDRVVSTYSAAIDPSRHLRVSFCCDAQRCPLVGFVRNGQSCMRRRNFIALLGGAAAAWPFAARAQQPAKLPVIGFLSSSSPANRTMLTAAFRQGLREGNYVDSKELAMVSR